MACALPVQLCAPAAGASASGGVSSFGYAGTIAHSVLRHAGGTPAGRLSARLVWRRRAFPWREPASGSIDLERTSTYAACWATQPGADAAPSSSPSRVLLLQLLRTATASCTPGSFTADALRTDADICIVGGGVTGVAIARDAAACGYSSIIIEREPVIGGVWA